MDDAVTSCTGDSTGATSATVTAAAGMTTLTVTGSPVSPGGTFTVATQQSNDIVITLTLVDGATSTQVFELHISCSRPICVGDRYGPLTLTDGE